MDALSIQNKNKNKSKSIQVTLMDINKNQFQFDSARKALEYLKSLGFKANQITLIKDSIKALRITVLFVVLI
jgi:hypothetical protein